MRLRVNESYEVTFIPQSGADEKFISALVAAMVRGGKAKVCLRNNQVITYVTKGAKPKGRMGPPIGNLLKVAYGRKPGNGKDSAST